MWSIEPIESSETNIKFSISDGNNLISHSAFLELLRDNQTFRSFYNEYLSSLAFEAFFWENKPVTQQTIDEDYECNIIHSHFLARCSPDSSTFQSYFRDNKAVVRFPNLGKDAQLVAPCPVKEYSVYTHIGNFVREAGKSQKQEFWKQVGEETLNQIGKEPRWLSTSGLGVYWLHVRIDSAPKYYQTEEYKYL